MSTVEPQGKYKNIKIGMRMTFKLTKGHPNGALSCSLFNIYPNLSLESYVC